MSPGALSARLGAGRARLNLIKRINFPILSPCLYKTWGKGRCLERLDLVFWLQSSDHLEKARGTSSFIAWGLFVPDTLTGVTYKELEPAPATGLEPFQPEWFFPP